MNIHLTDQGINGLKAAGQETSDESKLHYQQDAASYIAALLAELRNLSGMAELGKLTHALDTAYYEAYAIAEQRRMPRTKPAESQNADA